MIALFCFAAGLGAGFLIASHAADAALDSLRQAVERMNAADDSSVLPQDR